MGVKITDKMTPEGKKFIDTLRKLAEKEVRIGFQKGQYQDDDGTDICDIAMWNELGTANMPSRPFMRASVDDNEAKIQKFLMSKKIDIVKGKSDEQILKEVGLFQKDLIQEKIGNGDFSPNAPSTVKKKKSSKPLIYTGRMRQSVNYQIKEKGSD